MTVASIAVVVAVSSLGVVVGTVKDVVTEEAEASPMAPPLIKCAPKGEAEARSAGRSGAAVDIVINGRDYNGKINQLDLSALTCLIG